MMDMRRAVPLAVILAILALALLGSRMAPAPAAPIPSAPEAGGPAVARDGAALRLTGLPEANYVDWAPSGQTALVSASPKLYALRLDPLELQRLPDLGSIQALGWSGPDQALLVRWGGEAPAVGELSLLTGQWQPLARVAPGPLAICQNGDAWVWVEIRMVRQGGAGSRDIGTVHRIPAPKPSAGKDPLPPLARNPVLDRGALLGRLADGSCLLDGMNGKLLLLRPDGAQQTIADGFDLPEVTRDGRGVIWREKAGSCPDCIEVGPGVPFQRLVWWRLDGKRLTANLGTPQTIDHLLSPDGERLIIGHHPYGSSQGAISILSADGFRPGAVQDPARTPVGWMGSDLLVQPAGPERWNERSPIYRAADGVKLGEWLGSSVNGSLLLIDERFEIRYLSPDGAAYRLSHPAPFLLSGQGYHNLGVYHPQAPYVTVRQADGQLLVHLAKGSGP